MDLYNSRFSEPLGSSEVEALKKSYDKKDYRYQCSKPPLCNYCDASKCRKTAHGVGGGEILPSNRSLTKVETVPPIWYLDMVMPSGKAERISLSTEELQNPALFQKRCMETIHRMPPIMDRKDWRMLVDQLMEKCTVVAMPPDMTPRGQFLELFWDWLRNRAVPGEADVLLQHIPYKDDNHYYFRFVDLKRVLKTHNFTELRPSDISSVLKMEVGCMTRKTTVKGHTLDIATVPIPVDHVKEESLNPIKYETPY